MNKPNCIGIVTKKDDGLFKYYLCRLQFWKYKSMRLSGHIGGALSYGAYCPELNKGEYK